jgi:hypothetical protein
MAEIADKLRLQRTIRIVRAAAVWEREAQLLSRAEYEALQRGLDKLAEAVDLLTPALPDDLQP